MIAPSPKDCPDGAAEYFRSFTDGRYDPAAHLRFIYNSDETHLSEDRQAFFVGRPGADGIEFAYRKGHRGLWAFYPSEERWHFVAPDIVALERDWLSGELKV